MVAVRPTAGDGERDEREKGLRREREKK